MFTIQAHDSKPITWWYARRNEIDFDPPYQRKGRVWGDKNKAFLIDTVLNGYDIPKLYMADFRWSSSEINPKGLNYAVVDGKQRLEALFDFIEGRILLDKDFEFLGDKSVALGGMSYRDLKSTFPAVAEVFDTYTLSVVSVITDELARLNDLFVRLNTSKPLTGAELRNAMGGVLPGLFKRIASDSFFTNATRFKKNRGEDLNAAAKLLLLEFRGKVVETKKANLDRFVREAVEAESTQFEFAVKRALQVLSRMKKVFEPNDPLLSSPSSVPVYYWLIRDLPQDQLGSVRSTLVAFENARKIVRRKTRQGEPLAESDSAAEKYNLLLRSLDDAASLRDLVQILRERVTTEGSGESGEK